MRGKNLLVLALLILLGVGLSSWDIPHVHAAPTFSVDLDGNSTTSTDVLVQASATQTKTFRVGAVVNASNTNSLSNIFGWQFVINFNSTLAIPVGDPSPSSYPDGASNAVDFGAQTGLGAFNWQARLDTNGAFASFAVPTPGKVFVFYAILPPNPPVTLSTKTILANIAFEILTNTTSPQLFTITDVIFVDQNGQRLPDNIVHGANATETITNNPPFARFTATSLSSGDASCAPITGVNCSAYALRFDGSASSDVDGTIATPAGYFWDFGDGTQDSVNAVASCALLNCNQGAVAIHDYAVTGKFNATLRVVDNLGATGSARDSLGSMILNSQPSHTYRTATADRPPVASFAFSPTNPAPGATVSFDASASSDPDGTIVGYHWGFGDGNTFDSCVGSSGCSNTTSTSHVYASANAYTVSLTVTDNLGSTGTISYTLTANNVPVASFTFAPTNPAPGDVISFDAAASSDVDGTIASYVWNFGDGSAPVSLTTSTTSHNYVLSGAYTVTLTVTDNLGSTGTKTQTITVNIPPVASFTSSPSSPSAGGPVSFDASASSDSDGSITSYAWDFGDGSTGNGVTSSHSYTAAGTYTVTLTVTDNLGATRTKTQNVVVALNVPPVITSLSLSANPTSGQTVTLTIIASDSDGTITAIKVDWGDGTIDNLSGSQASPTHTYTSSGSFVITVTTTDNAGATVQKTTNVAVAGSSFLPGGPIPYIVIGVVAAVAAALFVLRRRGRTKPPETSSR